LALLLAAALAAPGAEAGFKGTLEEGVEFTIEIDNRAQVSDQDVAVTVTYLNRDRTKIRIMTTVTVPAGVLLQLPQTIPKTSTRRVFIDVEPTPNTTVQIFVFQGGNAFGENADTDRRLTFDIVPAP
jgi:hypothetical protein